MQVIYPGREIAKWGREIGKGRRVLPSGLPLWGNGPGSCLDFGGPVKNAHPRVTPPNDEEAGLFIHQLWLVVGRRLLPRVAPISSSLPHSRTDTAQWQKETLRHKDLGSGRWRSDLRALRG